LFTEFHFEVLVLNRYENYMELIDNMS